MKRLRKRMMLMKRQELIEYLNSDIYRLEGNIKLLI